MRLLIINSSFGPDYLADLFFAEMIYSGRYEIYTNHLPPYLLNDWPNPSSLYGRGYSVFSKLPATLKGHVNILNERQILNKISIQYFDRVIYTSIWRIHQWIEEVFRYYKKNQIIILDGEDHSKVLDIMSKVIYYKRELVEPFGTVCYPISFSFPSFYQPEIQVEQDKRYLLAPCVPGMIKSYNFNTEDLYYQQYSQSYFGLTVKKGGWDCLRHYEIIYSGSIPYFPDIADKPQLTMVNYPVDIQLRANELFQKCTKNPVLIENRYKEDLIQFRNFFTQWLKDFGSSKIYHDLIFEEFDDKK